MVCDVLSFLKYIETRIRLELMANKGESMENQAIASQGLWSRAREVAIQTPESRNRYVDFLRALSILAVISGHWLMAAPLVIDG